MADAGKHIVPSASHHEPDHADAKPAPKVVKKRNRRSLLEHRTFDIKPAGTAAPSSTSRPVITSATPQAADASITPATPGLRKHVTTIAPLTPAVAPASPVTPSTPAPPVPVVATVSPAPAPVAPVGSAPAPVSTAVAVTPAPAPTAPVTASATPVTTAVKPPVPDVTAPPTHVTATPAPLTGHEEDELALANLTGVHGIVEKPVIGANTPPLPEGLKPQLPTGQAVKDMHQTPEQARKLAAALNDLSHHPAPAVDDNPVVVVHQHDYLHSSLMFLGFLVGGALIIAIVFDLILDAGVLDLPVQPLTHFFKH